MFWGAVAYLCYTNLDTVKNIGYRLKGCYHIFLGDIEYKKQNIGGSIGHYKYALSLYPGHYTAWTNLGNIYAVTREYYLAAESYEQAILNKSNYIPARMNYGVISTEKLGDYDGAIMQYRAILDVKPKGFKIPFIYNNEESSKINYGLAYYNMGVAYKKKSIYSKERWEIKRQYLRSALDAYEHAVKILPKDYDTRFNLALTQQLLGDYNNSGVNYCKAIHLQPMNYEAHYNLAVLLKRLKYNNESLEELQKATALVMGSNDTSYRQQFIFQIMNDMTRTVLSNDLSSSDNPSKAELSEDEKEKFDNTHYTDFDKCPSLKLFNKNLKDEKSDYANMEFEGKTHKKVRLPLP